MDTHVDMPYRQHAFWGDVTNSAPDRDFDYERALAGGLNAPFMSIYIPAKKQATGGARKLADTLIDQVEAMVGRAPEKFAMAYSTSDIKKQFKRKKISLALGMENGAAIEGKLDNLEHFYNRGIRYITLTHGEFNHISDSSYDKEKVWKGLSPFGKTLVGEMNRIGIMVDVSHVSDEAFYEAVTVSKAPVIASHSSARHFTPDFERNMSDEMIKALADKGGVIMINYGSSFLTKEANEYALHHRNAIKVYMGRHNVDRYSPKTLAFIEKLHTKFPFPYANVEDVVDHIDHVVKLSSIDHVGIGSDYDGVGDTLPEGLKDVSSYPNLIVELLRRDYSEKDIKKILSGNILRVWREVEEYAAKN